MLSPEEGKEEKEKWRYAKRERRTVREIPGTALLPLEIMKPWLTGFVEIELGIRVHESLSLIIIQFNFCVTQANAVTKWFQHLTMLILTIRYHFFLVFRSLN